MKFSKRKIFTASKNNQTFAAAKRIDLPFVFCLLALFSSAFLFPSPDAASSEVQISPKTLERHDSHYYKTAASPRIGITMATITCGGFIVL
jgi:hypothetical protein